MIAGSDHQGEIPVIRQIGKSDTLREKFLSSFQIVPVIYKSESAIEEQAKITKKHPCFDSTRR